MSHVATLRDLFEQNVTDQPFARLSSEGDLSRRELVALSDQIAQRLPSGCNKLLLFGKTNINTLATIVACVRRGILLCPINASASEERKQKVRQLFNPDVIAFLAENGSLEFEVTDNDSAKYRHLPITPASPAICIYTSGSTGEPKGAVLTHENILSGIDNLINSMTISSKDIALCLLPLSHINGLVTTFFSIWASDSQVIYSQSEFDAQTAAEMISDYQCSWVSAAPFFIQRWLLSDSSPQKFQSVRFVRSASAPLTPTTISSFETRFNVPIVETMGMSEASGQIFANPVEGLKKPGSVGLPVGFEATILSLDGHHYLNANQEGEILIRGKALLKEYLDNPIATQSSFYNNWLKTGDKGYFDNDGYFFITGRIKDIAIFNGENISLRELEAETIDQVAWVRDAAAVTIADSNYGEKIVFYIVPDNFEIKDKVHLATVERLINNLLPSPSALYSIRLVERLPRGDTGKILKPKLVQGYKPYIEYKNHYSSVEELLSSILNVSIKSLPDNPSKRDYAQWDSLAQTEISMFCEQRLNRRLTSIENLSLTSKNNINQILTGTLQTQDKGSMAGTNQAIEVLKKLGLHDHEIIYPLLNIDFLNHFGVSDINAFLESLEQQLAPDQTLLMNAFTWDFCRSGYFDVNTSKSKTGLINEAFRLRPNTLRSPHPIYSYIAKGPLSSHLLKHESNTCWGPMSTTEKLLHEDVLVISAGVNRLKGNPVIHCVEERKQVPYREFKRFDGLINEGQYLANYSTDMFVRSYHNEHVNDWSAIERVMTHRNLINDYSLTPLIYSYQNRDLHDVAEELLNTDLYSLAKPIKK